MPSNLTGSNVYHTAITAPDAGDDRTAASVRGPFQQLIDNSFFLKKYVEELPLQNFDWTGHHRHGQEVDFIGDRNYRRVIPLAGGMSSSLNAAYYIAPLNVPRWRVVANGAVYFPLELPSGAKFRQLLMGVSASPGGSQAFARLVSNPSDFGSGGQGGMTVIASAYVPMSGVQQVLASPAAAVSVPIDRAANAYTIIIGDEGPGSQTDINWLAVDYAMPGLRAG